MADAVTGATPNNRTLGFARVALRMIGAGDIADAIADLTKLGRLRVDRLVASAATDLSLAGGDEFREVSAADKSWAQATLGSGYRTLAKHPNQLLIRESLVGAVALEAAVADCLSASENQELRSISEDARAYFRGLSRATAHLIVCWYQTDPNDSQLAVSVGVGATLEILRAMQVQLSSIDLLVRGAEPSTVAISDVDASLLSVEPFRAGSVQPLALGLGSWAYHGEVPPYTLRTVEERIAQSIAGGEPGLTVVVGPPKAGKSRTVLEILRRVNQEVVTWWVAPAPGVLPRIVAEAKRSVTAPHVIVLDDVHLHGLSPVDGLTDSRLAQLSRIAAVVVTIHERELANWARAAHDSSGDESEVDRWRFAKPTSQLINRLTAHAVRLPAELDPIEAAAAAPGFAAAQADLSGIDLSRMGEAYAAVGELLARAQAAQAEGGYRGAVVEAAVDATITEPAGATIDHLAALARSRYESMEPNTIWRETHFQAALDWATTGLGPRSPHAILTRRRQQSLGLLDALVSRLRHWRRPFSSLIGCDLSAEQAVRVGQWELGHGELSAAAEWFERAAAQGDTSAMVMAGRTAERAAATSRARDWYTQAVALGNVEAEFCLGDLLAANGQLAEARESYERASEAGFAPAMTMMGDLARLRCDTPEAVAWYRRAVDAGSVSARDRLGELAEADEDLDRARAYYLLAADGGSASASEHLQRLDGLALPGFIDATSAAFAGLCDRYQLEAADGRIEAMYRLGHINGWARRPKASREWFERAVASGHTSASRTLKNLRAEWEQPSIVSTLPQDVPVLVTSVGGRYRLDKPVVLGSRPAVRNRTGSVNLVTLLSPSGLISRSHVEVRAERGSAVVIDLDTTNGTTVVNKDGIKRLRPRAPHRLQPDDVVDLWDDMRIWVEAPSASAVRS